VRLDELPLKMRDVETPSVVVQDSIRFVEQLVGTEDHGLVPVVEVAVELDARNPDPLRGEADNPPGSMIWSMPMFSSKMRQK
jgi:hypothetical protein